MFLSTLCWCTAIAAALRILSDSYSSYKPSISRMFLTVFCFWLSVPCGHFLSRMSVSWVVIQTNKYAFRFVSWRLLPFCFSSKYLFNTFIYQKLFIFLNWVDREIYFLEPSAILVVMSSLNHCERKFTKWSGDIMRSERQFITDPQGITGTAIKAVSVSSISRLTAKQNIIRYQLVERIGEEVIRVS